MICCCCVWLVFIIGSWQYAITTALCHQAIAQTFQRQKIENMRVYTFVLRLNDFILLMIALKPSNKNTSNYFSTKSLNHSRRYWVVIEKTQRFCRFGLHFNLIIKLWTLSCAFKFYSRHIWGYSFLIKYLNTLMLCIVYISTSLQSLRA